MGCKTYNNIKITIQFTEKKKDVLLHTCKEPLEFTARPITYIGDHPFSKYAKFS